MRLKAKWPLGTKNVYASEVQHDFEVELVLAFHLSQETSLIEFTLHNFLIHSGLSVDEVTPIPFTFVFFFLFFSGTGTFGPVTRTNFRHLL